MTASRRRRDSGADRFERRTSAERLGIARGEESEMEVSTESAQGLVEPVLDVA